jgi:hypothetical protein
MTDISLEKLLESNKVSTADSQLVIKMPGKKLQVGKHSFNLTVEDDSGNQSTPALITVIVVDSTAPTAVLDLSDEQGRLISDGRVSFGSGFILNGKRSVDIGGSISKYIWEVVPA